MRKLYLGNGDKQFKFADTATEIHLNAFDDGSAATLTADANVRIKNDSGYLLGISASITDNHAVITSGQLAQLPVGSYLIELWDTVNGGTAIYPSDGFLALQINENVTGLSGGLVSSITVDDFIQQFSDLSQQLKKKLQMLLPMGLKATRVIRVLMDYLPIKSRPLMAIKVHKRNGLHLSLAIKETRAIKAMRGKISKL
ncbi:hypothetical protein RNZ42_11460 [Lacticaseibacillus paracasei]|nr:hypothetical protein RNZ42_11460 [Lacticaseibacillus paracasei]